MTTYTRPVTGGTPTTGQVVKAVHVNEPVDQIYDTILAGGITSDQIAAGAVDTSELATAAVTAVKMDGTLPDASEMATSAAPTTDKQLANKLYVDDGGERDVNGTPTVVHTKYFTGTLDSDSLTDVAHGVSGGVAKILFVGGMAFSDGNNFWYAGEVNKSVSGDTDFFILVDDTNVRFSGVGANFQGNGYRIKIDYID